MATSVHKILNAVLPMGLRTRLRRAALSAIPSMRHLDMPMRLRALRQSGFEPGVIHDIGAARGEWARLAASVWPHAAIVGFEPNARERAALDATASALVKFSYHLCCLGERAGEIRYEDKGTQTSVLDAGGALGAAVSPMHRLDALIAEGRVAGPDFLKLDVQGYELEVLRGAEQAMRGARAVLLEVSFEEFFPGVPTVENVVAFMDARGYAWHDVMGIIRRPDDDCLFQMDVLFVKKDDVLRRHAAGGIRP